MVIRYTFSNIHQDLKVMYYLHCNAVIALASASAGQATLRAIYSITRETAHKRFWTKGEQAQSCR